MKYEYYKVIKRSLDCLIAFGVFLILIPLLIILTILGYILMEGKPFFFQERIGFCGKKFNLVKFRTMSDKKDNAGNLLPDEERLTKYGVFLRTTSIDELPELLNIIKGDMALVGPRPLLERDVLYMTDIQNKRHNVRPGLTGLAQIKGRNNLNWDEKLEYDVQYIENISLGFDLKIIINTISLIIKRDGVEYTPDSEMDLKEWIEKKNQSE